MSTGLRGRMTRLPFAVALATLALSLHATPAAAQAPSLSINDVTMNEGNSGTTAFVFTVSLSDQPSGNFTIMVNHATANGQRRAARVQAPTTSQRAGS